jgi:hypothetical protein
LLYPHRVVAGPSQRLRPFTESDATRLGAQRKIVAVAQNLACAIDKLTFRGQRLRARELARTAL